MHLIKNPKHITKSIWRGSVLQLIGMIILPLALLVLIIAIGSTWLHQEAMRVMVGERDMLAIRTAAGAMNTTIEQHISTMRVFALYSSNDHLSTQERKLFTKIYADDFDLGLALFSPEGEIIFISSNSQLDWETIHTHPDFFNFLRSSVEQGEIIEWKVNGNPALLISAVSPNQQVIAVGGVSVESLSGQIVTAVLPSTKETHILIFNRDQQAVYQTGFSNYDQELAYHPKIENALKGANGTFLFKAQGIEHVVSYSSVFLAEWVLVMVEPWEAVATPTLEITRIAPLVLVPVLLITLVGLWFGTQQIVKPLRELEKKSDSLSEGNFNKINEPVGGIAEIRRLQTKLSQMAQKVQTAQRNIRDYIGAITEAQEDERRRLARELHDDTIQSMIALKQRVQLAKKQVFDTTSQQSLDEIDTIAEHTIENLRRTIRALRPIYLEDLGLVTSLEMLTKETTSVSGLTVFFATKGIEMRLPPQVELALYRIAQEAISNIVRHAGASQASLSIRYDDIVEMTISDNGTGFITPKTPTHFSSSGHFGLLGMYERADLIGAKLQINSSPLQGTQIRITYPLNHK